ncbi:MAG: hypothetical protein L3J07_04580 [Candidatus Magasanikbacteria bacterium]|nr:hypothetical protein [Candidatus Magasanikbacteria bacterium]
MREYNREQENEIKELAVSEAEEAEIHTELEKKAYLQKIEDIFKAQKLKKYEYEYEYYNNLKDKLFKTIDNYEGDKNDIYLYILDKEVYFFKESFLFDERVQDLNSTVANKLCEFSGGYNNIESNRDKFQNLNYKDIANRLIKSDQGYVLANNLEKFQGLDHQDIANRLIKSDQGYVLANNLEKFQGLDHQDIANRLIKSNNVWPLVNNLEKFRGLNHQELANKLIKPNNAEFLVKNLEKFQGLDHQDIASKLIENAQIDLLINNIEKFQGGLNTVSQGFQQNAQTNFGGKKEDYKKIFENQTPPHDMENQLLEEFLRKYGSFLQNFNELKEAQNISEEDKKYLESGKFGEEFLIPVCNSQSVGSFRFLDFTSKLIEFERVISEKDFSLLSEIAIRQGIRAIETMDFLTKQHGKYNESLSENKNLKEFIFSGLPTIQDIYKEYLSIIEDDSLTDLERKTELNNLKEKVLKIQGQIIKGGGENSENKEDEKMLVGLTYDVFSPASSIGRAQYENLLSRREDRTKDIPQELMDLNKETKITAVYKKFGFWNLKEGEKTDFTLPEKYTGFIDKINKTAKEKKEENKDWRAEYVKLAQQLLRTKKINWKEKNEVFQDIYRLIASGAVPGVAGIEKKGDTFEDNKQLLDLVGDKFKDAIDIALKTYKEENPEEYEKDVDIATKLVINKKAKKGIVKSMVGVLKQYTRVPKHKIFDEDTDRFVNSKIKRILKKYSIHFEGDILSELVNNEKLMESVEKIDVEIGENEKTEDIKARMEAETMEMEQILKEYFQEKLLNAEMNRNAGKLSSELAGKFFGEEKNKLQDDISKYEFVEGGGGSGKPLRLEISKHKLHSVAGLNMGVCVAVDEKLWNKETFMNVILWDDEIKKSQGGMHFEIVEDKGEKYLSLPGINPTPKLLASANPESIYDQMIEFAKKSAKAIGAKGVLIPTRGEIHSNRAEIHKIVQDKKYPVHSLENSHDFSYKPYIYSWKDTYFIEV